jgi:hypothetical protein
VAGTIVTGRTISWTSSNPSVATVSATGTVTTLLAGSATITATSEGKSGSALLTVTTPSPLPGSTACANEPTGLSQITNASFDAMPPSMPSRDAQGWAHEYPATNMQIFQDATAPKSPNNVLRTVFPAGMPGGGAPADLDLSFSNKTTLYVCLFLKRSANWSDNGNVGTKHFFVLTPYAGQPDYTHLFVSQSGQGYAEFYIESGSQSAVPNLEYTGPYDGSGSWVKYEYLFVANTPGAANGTFTAWKNGLPFMARSNIRYFPSGKQPAFNKVLWSPTYGGGTNPVPKTQYIDIDQWYVSGK